ESKRCDLSEKEVSIDFSARGTSKLKIALYAGGSKGKDDLLASKECEMKALATEKQPVSKPLTFPEKWTKMERHVRALLAIGDVLSEMDPRAKMVISLLNLGFEAFSDRLKRNDAILALIDDMSAAIQVTIDRDDPQFEEQREKQRETRDALLMEIYCCLAFVSLKTFIFEVETKGHLDTQLAVFRTEKLAKELGKVFHVRPPPSLNSCAHNWAFNPDGKRVYFLYGAAGKGKSAVAHAVALRLRASGALTPFFAFDRTTRDREAHQLFPTLGVQLARRNKAYHDKLCKMDPDDLGTRDINDQMGHLIMDLLGADDTVLVPVVFVIDALDECPDSDAIDEARSTRLAEERRTLLECLRQCILTDRLPYNVRFLITGRPDDDIRTYLASSQSLPITLSSINDARGTEADIRLFVREKLTGTPVAHMADDVAKAAQTLFECAALLCRELTKVKSPKRAAPRGDLVARVMRAPGQALY
ncbi:hypothetical protein K525DRAFT_146756, partial [Schizophyllum commune Loenen D]